MPSFHATEDKQFVRDRVFSTFELIKNVKAHAIHGDKHLAAPRLQSDSQLHALFGQALTKKKQGDFHGVIKPELKALRKPFRIYFQKMATDMNGQIADYVAWAKFVQLERNELRPWSSLASTLQPGDFNIFRNGNTIYY